MYGDNPCVPERLDAIALAARLSGVYDRLNICEDIDDALLCVLVDQYPIQVIDEEDAGVYWSGVATGVAVMSAIFAELSKQYLGEREEHEIIQGLIERSATQFSGELASHIVSSTQTVFREQESADLNVDEATERSKLLLHQVRDSLIARRQERKKK